MSKPKENTAAAESNPLAQLILEEFPNVFLKEIEPYLLPEKDKEWIESYKRFESQRKEAQDAHSQLKTWIQENKRYPKTVVNENNYVEWVEDDLQTIKDNLNNYPEAAIAVYLSWKKGWNSYEIEEIAKENPYAAYTLALKDPTADITNLQATMAEIPRLAYFYAKNIPKADISLALTQTEDSPYWHFLIIHKLLNDPEKAKNYLRLRLPYYPEAASTWIRLFDTKSLEATACMRCLETTPKWAYLTALAKKTEWQPNPDNESDPEFYELQELWNKLKNTALRDPQWAYHWWRDIEPENAQKNLESVAFHPGWAAQTIQQISAITKAPKLEMLGTVDSIIRDLFPQDDPFYTAYIFWAAEVITQESPDNPEETASEDS
jgi:hypothetical protein